MTISDEQQKAVFILHMNGAWKDVGWDQLMLGLFYQTKTGLSPKPRNIEACMWFNIAVGNFLEASKEDRKFSEELRANLMEKMSPEEIKESEIFAEAWVKQRPKSGRYFLSHLQPAT